MRRLRLEIRSRDDLDLLADLVWEAGVVEVRHATLGMRRAITRWVQHGVEVWEGPVEARTPTRTTSDDPNFLAQIHRHLKATSGFNMELRRFE